MTTSRIISIHPFPARMVPSIILEELPMARKRDEVVLDPMAGSGTTIVSARQRGYRAIGFDTDPLAVLIATVWSENLDGEKVKLAADRVLRAAKQSCSLMRPDAAYPAGADEDTRKFIRFWFDERCRQQLTALQSAIRRHQGKAIQRVLFCALSRLVITKKYGVSKAMDVSHSRPHRVYDQAPITPFEQFLKAVSHIVKTAPFKNQESAPRATVRRADARALPQQDESIDAVITSPPYLHAIDYMRGHKLSLVWMGYSVKDLRVIRSTNVGAHSMSKAPNGRDLIEVMGSMGAINELSGQQQGMVRRYVEDLTKVVAECSRVLRKNGRATFVAANSNVSGISVSNSKAIELLAERSGLRLKAIRSREINDQHRYLPAPRRESAGPILQNRMREEFIMTFQKASPKK